ncbi:MAG: hypothetical protein IKF44_01625 [Mycoplasmataceae bacterium]|nr:hypothetical protein [Mycoplasmataceae bacterium]
MKSKKIEKLKEWELGLFECLKFCEHTIEEQEEIKKYMKRIRELINILNKKLN